MYRIYVRKNEDGNISHASLSGIEQPDAKVVSWKRQQFEANEEVIVLKVPGHNYWSGRGEQSYAPAEYQIYKVLKTKWAGLLAIVETERLVDFPVRN